MDDWKELIEILERHKAYSDYVAHCIVLTLDNENTDYLREDILAYLVRNNY